MADDASITPSIHEHPAVEVARLRKKCERAVDQLLLVLDALGPDADDEPSLGFTEPSKPRWAGGHDQRDIALGDTTDREEEADGEPSLGSVGAGSIFLDQARWAQGARDDMEEEHDGREPDVEDEPNLGWTDDETRSGRSGEVFSSGDNEPSLGSLGASDQRGWAVGDGNEHEEQCEDEGAACEDEGAHDDGEPDDWGWEAPDHGTNYPSAGAPWPPGREDR